MIIEDLKHKAICYYGDSTWSSLLRVMITDGTSATIVFRAAKFFQYARLGPIAWFLMEGNKFFNGCVIGRGADFGPGLVLMHPIGVVINSAVRGGSNVVIESGVVIGAARNGVPVQVPLIGSNVFIGSGAKVLGGIRVGNNVTIGANAVVVKDVPDGATVVGVPARPLS